MKKTLVAFAAVAMIAAGSLAPTPASAQRYLGAAVAGGLIGGAIGGGALASSRPAHGGPGEVGDATPPPRRPMVVRCMWKPHRPRPAVGFASASGMVTAGASAASRSATDLTGANR